MHTSNAFDVIEWWQETGGDWANLAIFLSAIAAFWVIRQQHRQNLRKGTLDVLAVEQIDENFNAKTELIRKFADADREAFKNQNIEEFPQEVRIAFDIICNHYEHAGYLIRCDLIDSASYLDVNCFVVKHWWSLFENHILRLRERSKNAAYLNEFEFLANLARERCAEYQKDEE